MCWKDDHGRARFWVNTKNPVSFHFSFSISSNKISLFINGVCLGIVIRITGENKYYGTPINPQVPSCIPGGSSSGSAVAVAAGLVDFALGMLKLLVLFSWKVKCSIILFICSMWLQKWVLSQFLYFLGRIFSIGIFEFNICQIFQASYLSSY